LWGNVAKAEGRDPVAVPRDVRRFGAAKVCRAGFAGRGTAPAVL